MRIVIKVGSSTLTHDSGKFNLRYIDKLVRVISDIKSMGHQVMLVSSGAQVAGMARLHLKEKPSELKKKQALAAVGQCELMSIYDKFFSDKVLKTPIPENKKLEFKELYAVKVFFLYLAGKLTLNHFNTLRTDLATDLGYDGSQANSLAMQQKPQEHFT